MKKEIIEQLREYEDALTYRGISLLDRAEYELTMTTQTKLMLSPAVAAARKIAIALRQRGSRNDRSGMNPRVLFLVYTNTHVNTIIPIVKRMRSGFLVVKRDGLKGMIGQKLAANGIPFNDMEGYLTKESSRHITREKHRLRSLSREIAKKHEIEPVFLRYLFDSYFPDMIRSIELANTMLAVEKPRLLVVMHEITTLGNITVHVAHQLGIRTAFIQHGTVGDASDFVPVTVDHLVLWGDASKEAFIKKGAPAEKIFVAGAPQFDDLATGSLKLDHSALERLGVPKDKKVLMFATQPWEDIYRITAALCRVTKADPSLQLVLKTHPGEYSVKEYERIIRESGANVILSRGYLYELLQRCDVLITSSSTVAIEAMILGKPVITVNFTGKPDYIPYADEKVAIGVYREEDLAPAIHSVLYDTNTRKGLARNAKTYLYRHCYKIDGHASERIIQFIDSLTFKAS